MISIIDTIAKAGGLFAILAFNHLFIDFVFQSHAEATSKHADVKVRIQHCLIYTIGFFPIMYILDFDVIKFLIGSTILFASHFVQDGFYPVYLWAYFIRKPPEMDSNPAEGFILFIQTTLGKILMIVIDQIIHLTFLWAIVLLAMN